MGSICNEGGANEVQKVVKNGEEVNKMSETSSVGRVEETMPPLGVKDYEDLGWILELEDLGEGTSYENAGIDFITMFSDFFPEDEETETETEKNFHQDVEKEIVNPPPVVLPATEPSLIAFENWMANDPPELKSGGSGPSLSGDPSNQEFELMQWIWYPNSYQEFLCFNKK